MQCLKLSLMVSLSLNGHADAMAQTHTHTGVEGMISSERRNGLERVRSLAEMSVCDSFLQLNYQCWRSPVHSINVCGLSVGGRESAYVCIGCCLSARCAN